jgi:adenylosuccinate lyase
MREKGDEGNDLLDRLASDERLPLDDAALHRLVDEPLGFVGNAVAQSEAFVARVARLVAEEPEAAAYRPEPIL